MSFTLYLSFWKEQVVKKIKLKKKEKKNTIYRIVDMQVDFQKHISLSKCIHRY